MTKQEYKRWRMEVKANIARQGAIERERRLASGVRQIAKTIPSRRDKANDPRKQRKSRSWDRDFAFVG